MDKAIKLATEEEHTYLLYLINKPLSGEVETALAMKKIEKILNRNNIEYNDKIDIKKENKSVIDYNDEDTKEQRQEKFKTWYLKNKNK